MKELIGETDDGGRHYETWIDPEYGNISHIVDGKDITNQLVRPKIMKLPPEAVMFNHAEIIPEHFDILVDASSIDDHSWWLKFWHWVIGKKYVPPPRPITINLPKAYETGRTTVYSIKKIDSSSNPVIIQSESEMIDMDEQYREVKAVCAQTGKDKWEWMIG